MRRRHIAAQCQVPASHASCTGRPSRRQHENLAWRLAEFLTTVLVDAWTVPWFRCAAEGPGDLISHNDCVEMVFDHIATWAQRHENSHAYDFPELSLQTLKA